uniref:Uncharacterized protein n=1 Tax=Arundo donax TaxID=35708 RepID=A0A0A9C978_ARUDO
MATDAVVTGAPLSGA